MKRAIAVTAIICLTLFAAFYFHRMTCAIFELYERSAAIQRGALVDWVGYSAKVTWIEDGDTIMVTRGNKSQALRLYLIDAPEKGEPYSRRATDYLRHRILNEIVQVREVGRMNHGRLLAFVSFGGELINLSLLREGLAYLAIYHPEEEEYRERAEAAVEKAQKNARGIWR